MARKEDFSIGTVTLEGIGNGDSTVKVHIKDAAGKALLATGTTVPSSVAGYAKGCLFIDTDIAGGSKALYENVGTTASCTFNLVGDVTASEIALADGKVLVGNVSGVAEAVTISGDITVTNAGVAAIGASKVLAGMVKTKTVEITVALGNTAGSNGVDADLVNATVLGFYPSSNMDQLVDSIALTAGTGECTITLAAAATADNKFKVVFLRAA